MNDYYEELIDKYYDYSDQLKEVIKYSILEEGISDILYIKMLFLYLKIDGYNINELETKEEEEDENEEDIYIIEDENKKNCLYDSIKEITQEEYNKLISIGYLNKLTELNKLEIKKHQFKRIFKTINEDNKLLFDDFNNKHREHILNNSFYEQLLNIEYIKTPQGIPKYINYGLKNKINYFKLFIIKKLNKKLNIENSFKINKYHVKQLII
jgi:hypothetical protein